MSLRSNIENKLQNALKEKDKILISTLRLILAAKKDKDISIRSKDNREGIKDDDIKMVDLRFTDIPGTTQHFTVPIKFLTEDIFLDGPYQKVDCINLVDNLLNWKSVS